MDLHFSSDLLKAVRTAGVKSVVFKEDGNAWRGRDVDSEHVDPSDVTKIKVLLKREDLWKDIENRRLFKKLVAAESLKDVKKGDKVKKLEVLADAIKAILKAEAPHKWLFMPHNPSGALVPYFVKSVKYSPAERQRDNYKPAYVLVSCAAMSRGDETNKSITVYGSELPESAEGILAKHEAYIETEVLVAEHEDTLKKYRAESPKTGEQYLGSGVAKAYGEEGSWRSETVNLDRDGVPSRMVMDDSLDQKKDHGVASMAFWSGKRASDDDDDDEVREGDEIVQLPVHPIVRAFDLRTHTYCDVHIGGLEEYKYDDSLIDKLVLPKDHKGLVDALTDSAQERMSDIVKGKAQGIILLCSGLPGTGKTLSAEVYSEKVKRPLYTVQCSQLGTNEEELEKLLGEVLERAVRWKAILLIDEADVYIHERGDDIQQNAIVGVFLRLLEYFNGILFLTTNRATVIDDAILSRATAHVRYGIPAPEDRFRLWTILCKQYGVEPTAALLKEVTSKYEYASGRSIRQLIRLAKFMADRVNEKVSLKWIDWAATFHDFTEKE